jgi:hypothetical protein
MTWARTMSPMALELEAVTSAGSASSRRRETKKRDFIGNEG